MRKMSNVKKSILCAVCIALCYVLPLLFHGIQNAGTIFCPMHIPVYICGLVCGVPFGILCGIAGPVLSSALTGMPSIAYLPSMIVELVVYGAFSGLMMKLVHTKNTYIDLYISLIAAMLSGRVIAGISKALIFSAGEYSMAAWVSGSFLTSWPGIVIHLIFIPSIVFALMKAHLIPTRYPKKEN